MKKLLALLLAVVMVLTLTACGTPAASSSAATSSSTTTTDDTADSTTTTTTGDYTIAIVPKAAGNPFNEREVTGFTNALEEMGLTPIVQYPADATAASQITVLESLIAQKVDAIAVAANDTDALATVLDDAKAAGIRIVTLDSDTNGSEIFVNQAGETEVAQALCDAVLDLTGGEGQWAILSATSTASNQNAWIAAMEEIMASDAKYANLELVTTVYGDDESQKSTSEAQALLANYPDLKVICSPTTVGMAATAQVLTDAGSSVKLTGLGLPSEMAAYIGTDNVCPYMYLWNPIDMGYMAAYTCVALLDGSITPAIDDTFESGTLGSYTVIAGTTAPCQAILGAPFAFTPDNINDWKDVY